MTILNNVNILNKISYFDVSLVSEKSHFGRILNNVDPEGCNASSTLLGVTESIKGDFKEAGISILVSLDLSKALIDLITKICCNLIMNSCFQVHCVRSLSSSCLVGDSLCFLKVGTHINGSVVEPEVCSVCAFEDDIQVLFHVTHPKNALQMIMSDILDRVERWMKSNFMLLNISKSKIRRFGIKHLGDVRIQLRRGELESVDKLKILDVIIDRKLDYSDHIDDICSRVCFTLLYWPYHVRHKVAIC
uniref:Reverse transcriptase domain-containing protein n=1 Tax=Glossina austeni TaxID=7395 RepID=A0A1A9V137_GLOAU